MSLGLHVADHAYGRCGEGGLVLDLDRALDVGSVQGAACALRDAQVVHGDRSDGAAADALLGLGGGCGEQASPGQDEGGCEDGGRSLHGVFLFGAPVGRPVTWEPCAETMRGQ